ncbi:metallophosphoesterase family protein [Thermococcus sp.]
MRIVAISDIHGNLKTVRRLVESLNQEFDALLVAGDITHFSGAESARKVLEPLLEAGIKIVAVHGNCDGMDVPELLEKLGISAHDNRVKIGKTGIVGIGGSNITPFHTVWELSEHEIRGILERNYQKGDLILSHVPPHGTKADLTHSGLHAGSKALREFIEERLPPIVVAGHIHEARSIDKVGETLVVNPGPLFKGYYAVVDLDEIQAILTNL